VSRARAAGAELQGQQPEPGGGPQGGQDEHPRFPQPAHLANDARTMARECSLNRLVMNEASPPRSRVNLPKQMGEIERLRREMSAKPPDQRTITTRAVARILDDVHLEGRMGKFVVESDEPLARGGTEKGPSPLQYVMMGTAF
jgi:hypothetical protein